MNINTAEQIYHDMKYSRYFNILKYFYFNIIDLLYMILNLLRK